MAASLILVMSFIASFAIPVQFLDLELRSVLFAALAFSGLVWRYRVAPQAAGQAVHESMSVPVSRPATLSAPSSIYPQGKFIPVAQSAQPAAMPVPIPAAQTSPLP